MLDDGAHRRAPRRSAAAARQFEQRRRAVDELIYDEIARRREAPDLDEREDVFSMLLLARDEDGQPMSDHELRDELVTLLVAGHETTATGLAWAFELLLRNPPRPGAAAAPRSRTATTPTSTRSSRRRCGCGPWYPASAASSASEPFEVGGYLIPPGVEINPSIAVIHRRPDRYPEPGEFRPERFLGPGLPRHLHVAALRRRRSALPRSELRHLRDEGGDPAGARARAASGRRPPAREGRAQGRHVRAETRRTRDPDRAAEAGTGARRATLEAAGPPAGGALSSDRRDRLRSLRCTIRCGQSERSSARWW